MTVIQGKSKEGGVLLVGFIVLILLMTPWALPDVEMAWLFASVFASAFSLWGFCLLARRSLFYIEQKTFVRRCGLWAIFSHSYPLADFSAIRHLIINVEGSYFVQIELVGRNGAQDFLFATGAHHDSSAKALADPEMADILRRLSDATGLPIVE